MGYPQGIIRDEIYSVEIDYAAQQTEHHEINKPELHDQAEKGNSCLTEISNYRVNGKKHCHKGERKKDFRFSEVVHGGGTPYNKVNTDITTEMIALKAERNPFFLDLTDGCFLSGEIYRGIETVRSAIY